MTDGRPAEAWAAPAALPRVSFIVATLDEADHIERCIQSVVGQDYPVELLEVAVVDGGSTDGTQAVVRALIDTHPCITLWQNPKRWASSAFNIGIRNTHGEIVTLVGAHSEVDRDYASNLVRAFAESGASLVGGLAVASAACATPEASAIARAMSSPIGVGSASFRYSQKPQWVDTAFPGAYKRKLLDEIGLFDERLQRNQDDDLHFRARAAGYRMWFDPSLVSTYFTRPSLRLLFEQYAGYGVWRCVTIRKHRAVASLRHLAAPGLLLAVTVGAAPLPVARRTRRAGLATTAAAYVSVLGLGTARERRRGARGSELALVPPAFVTMHLAYGWGFWRELLRQRAHPARGRRARRT